MTVIFGIIKKDGLIAERQELEQMHASVKHFPHDNNNLWNGKNTGFGWVQLYDTPESVYDNQPFSFHNNEYIMVGKARLDNRSELCGIFNITSEERKTTPDTKLLQFAFEKWGKDCTKKLFGDWCFAVWNNSEKQLFMARDHLGITALYYSLINDSFVFATNKTVLLSIPSVSKQINKVQIAQLLAGWNGYAEETVYADIFRLPPSCSAVYRDGKISVSKYWNPENIAAVSFKKDSEYVDAFNELFLNAVKSRIRTDRPVASMLSGGLDSTSVTALAASELAKNGKKMKAYTSVPVFNVTTSLKPYQYGDESELAGLVSGMYPNIEHILVKSENKNPLQGIYESLKIHNSPLRNSSNFYWLLSISELANKSGIGTMLNGQGGNFTVSWPFRGYYLNFMKPGIKSFLRKNIPDFAFRFRYQIMNGKKPYLKNSLINPEFEVETGLAEKMKKAGYDPYFISESSLQKTRIRIINVNMAQGSGIIQENGDYFGINVYDPTLDIKLLEFCFAIPDNQFVRPGYDRFMIRRAMKNKLPDKVLYNEKKGKQSADLIYRIKENINDYFDIIKKINESELCKQLIDVGRLNRMFLDIDSLSEPDNFRHNYGFMPAINTGLFLLQNDK